MSFSDTDFGAGGQGLPGNIGPSSLCANGHANLKDAKSCSTCGITIWTPLPPPTQHERIEAAARANGTCENGHTNKEDAKFCATCGVALPEPPPPAETYQTAESQTHSNAFGTSVPGSGPFLQPDERDRPNAMIVWLWMFVFSPVVLFLAPSYANKAKRLGFRDRAGRPQTARYWWPFFLALFGWIGVIAFVIYAATALGHVSSTYHGSSPSYSTPQYTAPAQIPAQGGSGGDYSYSYSVSQGESSAELQATAIILASTSRSFQDGTYRTASAAVCARDTQPASVTPYPFDCNIAFTNGMHSSYWVTIDNGDYTAIGRTHY